MWIFIALALVNGVCISLSRIINGRLGQAKQAFYASFCNHWVGFIFLTLALLLWGGIGKGFNNPAPWIAYLGGIMGACFVAINSFILPRTGALQAALLIIGGQMLTGVIVDQLSPTRPAAGPVLLGCGLIIVGIWLAKSTSAKKS